MNTDTITITPEALKQEKPLQVPPVPQDTTNYAGIISGVGDSIAKDYEAYNTQLQNAQQNQNQTAGTITNLLADLAGRTADTQQAQEQAGVNTETQNVNKIAEQLLGLNAQASQLNREAQAIPLQIQQEAFGRGVTDRGIAPIETSRLRDNAIKALSIAQQSDIAQASLQGSQIRLQQAKDKAQQIVDLKYKPKEDLLTALKTQYDLNKDYLSSVDKKRAEALNIRLAREEEVLKTEKENAKAISDMVVNASAQNAPTDLVARANKVKTRGEAAMILGQYAGDYYKTELLKQQIATEKAQRAKIYDSMNSVGTGTGGQVTPKAKLTPTELGNVNETIIAKNKINSQIKGMIDIIERSGTQQLIGTDAGTISSLRTQLLLSMKNLEKTGALDKGTIDVLAGAIPESEFFATEQGQKAKLSTLLNEINTSTDEYLNSYKGTDAEIDPRTSRYYSQSSKQEVSDSEDFENIFNKVNSNTTTTKSFISGFNFNQK